MKSLLLPLLLVLMPSVVLSEVSYVTYVVHISTVIDTFLYIPGYILIQWNHCFPLYRIVLFEGQFPPNG